MMITTEELILAIEEKNSYPFDPEQRDAILHNDGPLWIIAGPGTGKTEVLVMKVVKLLCCNEIDPQSIIVTTFTEKAALNLESRIAEAMLFLMARYPNLSGIDYCQLRVGTIHSLCSDIMQEYRYSPFQNVRLLDDVEQAMFIRKKIASYARDHYPRIRDYFFPVLLSDRRKVNSNQLWIWTKVLSQLFDRIVEDDIDLVAMKNAGGHWEDLVSAFQFYENSLVSEHACDFSHLQKYFCDFLETGQGTEFLLGSGQISDVPISAVLVDEYQDTNPIQERIYMKLASNHPHSLCVVGDDDQALYRFRGGTVDCMISFPDRCKAVFGMIPQIVSLRTNHRSNERIVEWCNDYIESFDAMKEPGARISIKPPAKAVPNNPGFKEAVGLIRGEKVDDVANAFADTVREILEHGIIEDLSQCVLILPSTKDSPRAAGPYISALRNHAIPIYNPRAKDFLEHAEVKELLGVLVSIIDPSLDAASRTNQQGIIDLALTWNAASQAAQSRSPALKEYVEKSARVIQTNTVPKRTFAEYAAGILYRILSFEPFTTYQASPDTDLRLSKITRVFEAFISLYGRSLDSDSIVPNSVNGYWISGFYYSLCGYFSEYGMDDDEDEEVICPKGYLPLMTIHQSKGLEFDFVFAGNLGRNVSPDAAHALERDYSTFRRTPVGRQHSVDQLAWQDDIRKHFVTYSRAKHALILLATNGQLRKRGHETSSFSQNGGVWFKNEYPPI